MSLVDNIKKMQNGGQSEESITKSLTDQGFTPREITEGLSQSKLNPPIAGPEAQQLPMPEQPSIPIPTQPATQQYSKQAPQAQSATMPVTPPTQPMTQEISEPAQMQTPNTQSGGMQSSIMNQAQSPQKIQDSETSLAPMQQPATQQYSEQMPQSQPATHATQQPQQGQYTQEAYDQGGGYDQANYGYPEQYEYGGEQNYESGYEDTSIINEIAEQVVLEKTEELIKGIDKLISFKESSETKINELNTRLEKIEKSFSELQTSILRRIGKYTQDVGDIKTELKTMQGSFSKMVNPLTDNIRQLEAIAKSKPRKSATKTIIKTRTITRKPRKRSPEQIRKLRLKNLEKARRARKKKAAARKKPTKKTPKKKSRKRR